MPRFRISDQALDFVRSPVANPGMVNPRMSERGQPSWSKARAATRRACVESNPPETPMHSRPIPVVFSRFIRP